MQTQAPLASPIGFLTALLLLWLGGVALRLTILAVPPVIPLIHADLHMSETQVGILTGLPMVLSDVGGAPTVVENGVNGLIVPNSDDPAELAEAMRTISSRDRHQAMKTAAALRTNRFTLERMVQETEAVYRKAAGR